MQTIHIVRETSTILHWTLSALLASIAVLFLVVALKVWRGDLD